MSKEKQTIEDLQRRMNEHLGYIRKSADAFDAGDESEARRIAVSIRVLVRDTKNMTSLLTQLGKKNVGFVDTCVERIETGGPAWSGLVMLHSGPLGTKYDPNLDSASEKAGVADFDTW